MKDRICNHKKTSAGPLVRFDVSQFMVVRVIYGEQKKLVLRKKR